MSLLCTGKKSRKPFFGGTADVDSEDDGTSYGFVSKPAVKNDAATVKKSNIRYDSSSLPVAGTKRCFRRRRVSFKDDDTHAKENIPCNGSGSCRLRRFHQPPITTGQRQQQQQYQPHHHWSYPPFPTDLLTDGAVVKCFDGSKIYDVLPKPNIGRSVSFTDSSVICGHYLRNSSFDTNCQQQQQLEDIVSSTAKSSYLVPPLVVPPPPALLGNYDALLSGRRSSLRPPPYSVAVKRAASFSTSRGVVANRLKKLSCPPTMTSRNNDGKNRNIPTTTMTIGGTSVIADSSRFVANSRGLSSSTSDLYVDSVSLRKVQSRELLSTASSTSSVSEATVYQRIGPCNYVGVSSDKSKRIPSSSSSSCNNKTQWKDTMEFVNGNEMLTYAVS